MAHSVDDITKKLEEIKITDDIFCGEDLTYEKELFECRNRKDWGKVRRLRGFFLFE